MERTWSTEQPPGRGQFPHWREAVGEPIVPVQVSRDDDDARPSPSRVSARHAEPRRVSRIASEAQSVTRTAAVLAAQPGETVCLDLPLTGGSSAGQDGRTASLAPGDVTILDSPRPFRLGSGRPFSEVSVQLPSEPLGAGGVGPAVTATRINGNLRVGAIASAALRTIAAGATEIDSDTARVLAEKLCDLVALALTEEPAAPRRGDRGSLTEQALEHIDALLGNPTLAPRDVAERIAVSPRQLHRMFADQGTTFGRTLLERRLARGEARLRDAAHADRTIGEIAHEVGFADPSYFARAFRIRYGVSPREVRRGMAHGAPRRAA